MCHPRTRTPSPSEAREKCGPVSPLHKKHIERHRLQSNHETARKENNMRVAPPRRDDTLPRCCLLSLAGGIDSGALTVAPGGPVELVPCDGLVPLAAPRRTGAAAAGACEERRGPFAAFARAAMGGRLSKSKRDVVVVGAVAVAAAAAAAAAASSFGWAVRVGVPNARGCGWPSSTGAWRPAVVRVNGTRTASPTGTERKRSTIGPLGCTEVSTLHRILSHIHYTCTPHPRRLLSR
jgi:hypothetical protein